MTKELIERIKAHQPRVSYWWCCECERLENECKEMADPECYEVPTKFVERKESK